MLKTIKQILDHVCRWGIVLGSEIWLFWSFPGSQFIARIVIALRRSFRGRCRIWGLSSFRYFLRISLGMFTPGNVVGASAEARVVCEASFTPAQNAAVFLGNASGSICSLLCSWKRRSPVWKGFDAPFTWDAAILAKGTDKKWNMMFVGYDRQRVHTAWKQDQRLYTQICFLFLCELGPNAQQAVIWIPIEVLSNKKNEFECPSVNTGKRLCGGRIDHWWQKAFSWDVTTKLTEKKKNHLCCV